MNIIDEESFKAPYVVGKKHVLLYYKKLTTKNSFLKDKPHSLSHTRIPWTNRTSQVTISPEYLTKEKYIRSFPEKQQNNINTILECEPSKKLKKTKYFGYNSSLHFPKLLRNSLSDEMVKSTSNLWSRTLRTKRNLENLMEQTNQLEKL